MANEDDVATVTNCQVFHMFVDEIGCLEDEQYDFCCVDASTSAV
jgi:hypothetical protein